MVRLLRVITDVLDALEQGAADEASGRVSLLESHVTQIWICGLAMASANRP